MALLSCHYSAGATTGLPWFHARSSTCFHFMLMLHASCLPHASCLIQFAMQRDVLQEVFVMLSSLQTHNMTNSTLTRARILPLRLPLRDLFSGVLCDDVHIRSWTLVTSFTRLRRFNDLARKRKIPSGNLSFHRL